MKLSHQQNMKFELVIFDFDGTIADTSPGILDSHRYALNAMGREVPPESELLKVIGGQLLDTYIAKFEFDEQNARKAVRIYRERYAEVGIHMATLYTGFAEMLKKLKDTGYMIGVATLKAEKFARTMLEEFGIKEYIDEVCGMDENDQLDKAGLIEKCVSLCGVSNEKTVLVGDSNNDWTGSQKANVGFIGVTYGFGFKPENKYDFVTAKDTDELLELLK